MTDQVAGTVGYAAGTGDHLDGARTLEQAAAYFRVSERTLRQRIKSGAIHAYKMPTAQGYEGPVLVDRPGGTAVEVDAPTIRQPVQGDTTSATPALLQALDLVARLRRATQQRAGQLGAKDIRLGGS